mmetsp:Transcript_3763/g.12109  ORF Transcript_3763/g.12109 Transcript_3763/m.12109 type:complete len:225 (-) Transcript_3763:776-1450(-)
MRAAQAAPAARLSWRCRRLGWRGLPSRGHAAWAALLPLPDQKPAPRRSPSGVTSEEALPAARRYGEAARHPQPPLPVAYAAALRPKAAKGGRRAPCQPRPPYARAACRGAGGAGGRKGGSVPRRVSLLRRRRRDGGPACARCGVRGMGEQSGRSRTSRDQTRRRRRCDRSPPAGVGLSCAVGRSESRGTRADVLQPGREREPAAQPAGRAELLRGGEAVEEAGG